MVIAGVQCLNDSNLRPVVQIGDPQLKRVSSTIHHGVEIDDRLSWRNHIEKYPQVLQ